MIRQHREWVLVRIALTFLLFASLLLPGPLGAGEPAPKKGAGAAAKKKKKKKIPPFKCSAWCSFSDFILRMANDPEKKKKDPSYDIEKDMETRPGSNAWEGYGRRGKWVSLVVEIQNTTKDKPYSGNIRVQLDPSRVSQETGAKPYTTRYRQPFELAPKTKQSFHFCVLCPEFDFDTVNVRVTANGRPFDRYVRLYDLDDRNERLIVVVSDRGGAYKFLTEPAKDDVMAGSRRPKGRRVAVVQPEELPNRWYNLALASLIIIDGPPRDGLSDDQIEALRGYCQAGGQVMISSGLDPARLRAADGRERSIADLVGMRVRDLKRVNKLKVAPNWQPKEGDSGISVVDVTANTKGGNVSVIRNDETQLVEKLTRQVGLGSVTFFAFSLAEPKLPRELRQAIPLALMRGRHETLFSYQRKEQQLPNNFDYYGYEEEPAPAEPIERLRAELDRSFDQDTPVETPKRGVVASFLLLYLLVAVPLNYFIFGWFRRREIAWAAVPLWALFFSIGAYVVGYQQGRLTIDQLTVVEAGPNQPEGLARTFMGVYAPRRGNYRFRFEADERLSTHPHAGPGHLVSTKFLTRGITSLLPEMDILEEPNGDLLIEKLEIYARATRRMEIQHLAPLGEGIDVQCTEQPDGKIQVAVQNGSPLLLLSSVLAYSGTDGRWRAIRLGNLKKKMVEPQVSVHAMGPNDGQSIEDAFFARPPYFPSAAGQTSSERAKAVGAFVQSRLNKYRTRVLLAWADQGMLPVTTMRGSGVAEDRERGMTLLILPVAGIRGGGGGTNWSGQFTTEPPTAGWAVWDAFALHNGAVEIAQPDRSLKTGRTHVELFAPSTVLDLKDRQFSLSFMLRALNQQQYAQRKSGMFNGLNMALPDVPSRYSGKLKVEIGSWKSNVTLADDWREVYSVDFRHLNAGAQNQISFTCDLQRDELGPDAQVMLRVQLSNITVQGAEWAEQEWALDLVTFRPQIKGKDTSRR